MAIWKNHRTTLNDLEQLSKNTMAETLGMTYTEIGEDYLKMSMPVNEKVHQPYGLLHGGASAALAETIGSVASSLCIDNERQICVGISLNCNHIRGVRSGLVSATARPLHIGSKTHVWDIKITTEAGSLVCAGRLTVAILDKKRQ